MSDPALGRFSDEELRAEVRRRGYEMHSKQFSEASQRLMRELPELRRRCAQTDPLPSAGTSLRAYPVLSWCDAELAARLTADILVLPTPTTPGTRAEVPPRPNAGGHKCLNWANLAGS